MNEQRVSSSGALREDIARELDAEWRQANGDEWNADDLADACLAVLRDPSVRQDLLEVLKLEQVGWASVNGFGLAEMDSFTGRKLREEWPTYTDEERECCAWTPAYAKSAEEIPTFAAPVVGERDE